jgi:hypothetical protein
MTAIATILDPPDACPACPPGIPDAALPVGPVTEADGGLVADYECSSCGCAWSALFDEHWWPVERIIAPVAEPRAAA